MRIGDDLMGFRITGYYSQLIGDDVFLPSSQILVDEEEDVIKFGHAMSFFISQTSC